MIIGLSISAFTMLHVAISLIAIALGLIVLADMLRGLYRGGRVNAFLTTTILTSVTGFMFPSGASVTPGQIVGAISLVVLALALIALFVLDLKGIWRTVFVVSSIIALYLNVFVAVVQAFQKIPSLAKLAPTQSELPFLLAQVAVLLAFAVTGWRAARRSAPDHRGSLV